MTTDCTPRYVQADPETGGEQAVAEAWRNLTAVGARPLAITDNLNFGNPQRPEIMGQFVGAIEGMAEACRRSTSRSCPATSRSTTRPRASAILPTPTIGGVGLIDDIAKAVGSRLTQAGLGLVLVGETKGWLGQSLYLREVCGREDGAPPPVDLAAERRNGDFVRGQIAGRPRRRLPRPVRRRPAGGAGRDGHRRRHRRRRSSRRPETPCPSHAFLLRRGPGPLSDRHRRSADDVLEAAAGGRRAGRAAGLLRRRRRWWSTGCCRLPLGELQAAHEAWLPAYMSCRGITQENRAMPMAADDIDA